MIQVSILAVVYAVKTEKNFKMFLKKWYFWPTQSHLASMNKAAKAIKKHRMEHFIGKNKMVFQKVLTRQFKQPKEKQEVINLNIL